MLAIEIPGLYNSLVKIHQRLSGSYFDIAVGQVILLPINAETVQGHVVKIGRGTQAGPGLNKIKAGAILRAKTL